MDKTTIEASAPCGPCQADDHRLCYFWERRRWWSPCGCKHETHEGKPAPVEG